MSASRPTVSEFLASPYDPELERKLFTRILLPNGMFKTTDCQRLDDVNKAVLPFIEEIRERPVEIMDVGASSGIGAQEWSDQLSSQGVQARVTATDRFLKAGHLRCGFVEALLDDNANILHLAIFNRSVPVRGTKLQTPVIVGVKLLVRILLLCRCRVQPIRLISKAVRDVIFVEDDIEEDDEAYQGRFYAIRAANILTSCYFTTARLQKMAAILVRRLRPGGFLIVGRTLLDGSNHATIFKWEARRLSIATRVGAGSEIEEIVLATDLS